MDARTKTTLATFLTAARIVVGYEDDSALNGLSQLNNTGEVKASKHIREIKAVMLQFLNLKVDELKGKLKNVKYVEEDKMAHAWASEIIQMCSGT
jgi:hypothetical protein